MMSLEKRVQALQDDLFSAQDELQAFQDRYDEVRNLFKWIVPHKRTALNICVLEILLLN